jgi:hypothetical protein
LSHCASLYLDFFLSQSAFQELEEGEMKENSRRGEFMYDIFDTLCKCHNVPPYNATLKEKICIPSWDIPASQVIF